MSKMKKHTDVVASMEEFTLNYNDGVYIAPWIVYIGDNIGGYTVIYSNDENKAASSVTPNVIESLNQRINKLENEKIFCYESEYTDLVENGKGWVTNVDGTRTEVSFDKNKLYFIYEEDGVIDVPDEPIPDEPDKEIEFIGNVVMPNDYSPELPIILTNVKVNVTLNNKKITAPVFAESDGQILEGNSDSYAFWVKDGANLTIEGDGIIEAQEAKYSMAVWADGGHVIIKGGSFYNNGNNSDLIYASKNALVEIFGGEFHANKNEGADGTKNPYPALNVKDKDRATAKIVVYGGRFFKFNPADNMSEGPGTNFVADGYESIQEGDWWIVREVTYEPDFTQEEITLKNNYSPNEVIVVENASKTLNLNDKTMTAPTFVDETDGSTNSVGLWVKNGGNVTINGNGTIAAQDANYSMAVWANGGNVTINGGTFINHGDGCDLIYASAGGKVIINGGDFKATEYRGDEAGTGNKHSALNIKNSDREISDIIVYGGKFYGFDPANNVSEPNPSEKWLASHPNGFVAEGYKSVEVAPDVWEIMAE